MAESINQSMHIYIVPCVASETVAQNKTKIKQWSAQTKQNYISFISECATG